MWQAGNGSQNYHHPPPRNVLQSVSLLCLTLLCNLTTTNFDHQQSHSYLPSSAEVFNPVYEI